MNPHDDNEFLKSVYRLKTSEEVDFALITAKLKGICSSFEANRIKLWWVIINNPGNEDVKETFLR